MRYSIYSILIASCVLTPSLARAQWQPNGTPVCGVPGYQANPSIAPDGAGGVIVVWEDARSGTNIDIYAQRLNPSGVAQWTAGGVAMCIASKDQLRPVVISGGGGGAIVAWEDERALFRQVFAQRVDASGTVTWPDSGITASTITSNKFSPRITSDGSAGAIISWLDFRAGNFDVYAQRVNTSGILQWTTGGVPVCTAANDQSAEDLIPDGFGGAIITWMDGRVPGTDIYVQRVDALGDPQWATNGVALCSADNTQFLPQLTHDGAGGAIVTWYDTRGLVQPDIYAGRVDAAGVIQWTANGVVICNAANSQTLAQIAPDGAGGAVIAWQDQRSGTSLDAYAQRVNGAGVAQWTANGVAVSTATRHQSEPRVVSDGAGGAIIAWDDSRNSANDHDVYAQRVNASGIPQWTFDGVPIAATLSDEQKLPILTPDGFGGAIIVWQTYHYQTGEPDIYALRYPNPPTPVGGTPALTSLQVLPNFPNPFNASTRFDVYLPVESGIEIEVFDVAGRRVRSERTATLAAGWRDIAFDARDNAGNALPSGVYFYRVKAAGETITRKIAIAR